MNCRTALPAGRHSPHALPVGLFSYGWHVVSAVWLGVWLFTWAEYLVTVGRQAQGR